MAVMLSPAVMGIAAGAGEPGKLQEMEMFSGWKMGSMESHLRPTSQGSPSCDSDGS